MLALLGGLTEEEALPQPLRGAVRNGKLMVRGVCRIGHGLFLSIPFKASFRRFKRSGRFNVVMGRGDRVP